MAAQPLYGIPLADVRMALANTNSQTVAMSASNNALASFFAAESGHGAIVGMLYLCTAVSAPPAYRFSLQGISARGTPDGTVKGGASPASITLTPSAGFFQATFTNPYIPTAGELLSVACEYASGTVGAGNRISLTARGVQLGTNATLPYSYVQSAGSWAVANGGAPCMAPVYADGYVARGFCAFSTLTNNVAASTLYGSVLTPSVPMSLSAALVGIWPAAGSYVQATLYEGASTTIASTTAVAQSQNFSCDLMCSLASAVNGLLLPMPSYTMKAGTTYRLVASNSGTAYTSFPAAVFDRQPALQAAWGPLAGTIGAGGTWTDYASGSDWRAIPVIPCVDTVSGGGLFPSAFLGGFAE